VLTVTQAFITDEEKSLKIKTMSAFHLTIIYKHFKLNSL